MERDPTRYPPGGVVYRLSENNIEEALSTGLLGMPDGAWSFVQAIQIGTPVFLYDEDNQVVHGVFEAKSPGTFNLNPLAYRGTWQGSPLPCQVQVQLHYRYEPASLLEFDSVPGLVLRGGKMKLLLSKTQVNQMYGIFNHILERQQRREQQPSLSSGMGLPFLPLPPPVQPEIPPAWTGSSSSNGMALHTSAAAAGQGLLGLGGTQAGQHPGFPQPDRACSGRRQRHGGDREPLPRGPAWQSAQPQPSKVHSQGLTAGHVMPADGGRAAQRGSRLRPQRPGSSSGPDRGGSLARAPITSQSHHPQGQLPPPATRGPNPRALDDGRRTTVILNNIPGELTIEMAIDGLDANGFYGAYDFFYFIPTGPEKTGCIIINLVDHYLAEAIFEEIDAITARWPPFRRPPKPPVQWATQQGLAKLHATYPRATTRDVYLSEWCIGPRSPTFFDLARAEEAATAPPGATGSGMPVLPRDHLGFAMEEELPPPYAMPPYARMPAAMMVPYEDSMPPWAGQNGRKTGREAGMKRPHSGPTGQVAKKRARSAIAVQTVQPVATPAKTSKHTAHAQQKNLRQPGSQAQPQREQRQSDSLTQRLHSALGSKPTAATAASAPPKQPGSQLQRQSKQQQSNNITHRLNSALGSKPTAATAASASPKQSGSQAQPQCEQRQSDSLTERLYSALGSRPTSATAVSAPSKQPGSQPQRQSEQRQSDSLTQRLHSALSSKPTATSAPKQPVRQPQKQGLKPVTGQEFHQRGTTAAQQQLITATSNAPASAASDTAKSDAARDVRAAASLQTPTAAAEAHGLAAQESAQPNCSDAGKPVSQSKAGARTAVHVRAEGRAAKHQPIVWNHEQAAGNAAKVHSQPGSTSQPPGSEFGGTVGGDAPTGSRQSASGLGRGSQNGAVGELERAPFVQKLPHSTSEGQKGPGSPEGVPLAIGTGQGIGILKGTAIKQRSQDTLQQDVGQDPVFDFGANFVEI